MTERAEVRRLPKDQSWRVFFEARDESLWKRWAGPVPAHAHGTTSGYTNYSCRCAPCKAAGSEANRKARAKRHKLAQAGLIAIPHGTENGYGNYGCRCVKCKLMQRYRSAPGDRRRTFKRPESDEERMWLDRVLGHRPVVGGPWLLFFAILHDTMRGRRLQKFKKH